MSISLRLPMALLVSLVLPACALLDNQYRGSAPDLSDKGSATEAVAEAVAEDQAPEALARSADDLAGESDRVEPVLYRGNDKQVKMPAKRAPVKLVGEAVSLNFEEAPLGEVVHAVLGDILELDYIVDHPVQGKITLRSRTPIPREQLLEVLESLLKANNVLMVRDAQGRFLITGSQQARRMAPRLANPAASGAGYSTVVIPLQYISASNMAEILRPVAEESAFVRVDNTRNLLILAGTQAQLDGWQEMITTFDVDLLKGMSVGLFPLEHSGVLETAEVLNGMLASGGDGGGQGGGFSQLVNIIPIKRLNSLLVVAPRAHFLETVDTWIRRLDAAPDSNFAKRLYVYPVQNTTAARLAGLLTSIYSGGSGGSQGGYRAGGAGGALDSGGVAPGLSMESLGDSQGGGSGLGNGSSGTGSFGGSGAGSGASSGGSNPGRNTGAGGFNASSVSGIGSGGPNEVEDVRVVADDENNALMIYATGKQYEIITDALEQLDVVATQVIIEASILEVTLNENLKYGLEWSFKAGLGGSYDAGGQLVNSGNAPSRTAPGFSYSVTNSAGEISAVLNALAEDSLVNVISTPSVMVLDNHTAFIHVGDQVPVLQGSSVSDGGTTTQNIQYRDTGVQLNVRPSVNAGRLVTMDVEQSVTDVGTVDTATGQRSFLERSIMSRVAVRSDESVVLGGLIRENATSSDSGVPFLHRIPVVGSLFGSTTNQNQRTELLVILTPRVIASESELRDVSTELRSRVREMEILMGPAE